MAAPIVLSPSAAYATKDNILYPGTDAQATAAEAAAKARIDAALPNSVVVTVPAGSIVAE